MFDLALLNVQKVKDAKQNVSTSEVRPPFLLFYCLLNLVYWTFGLLFFVFNFSTSLQWLLYLGLQAYERGEKSKGNQTRLAPAPLP